MTTSRKKKFLFALMAALSAAAIIVPALVGLLSSSSLMRDNSSEPLTSKTTAPVLTIKPLPVRPVISAFVTTPEQCPPSTPVPPPDQPTRICDIERKAVYELGPQALTIQLTNVDSFRNPLTGVELVQMTMTRESSEQFGKYTAGQVGKQVAFVRSGTVVWGPKIAAPIDGEVLQLSGELTPEQAKAIARKLKDET